MTISSKQVSNKSMSNTDREIRQTGKDCMLPAEQD